MIPQIENDADTNADTTATKEGDSSLVETMDAKTEDLDADSKESMENVGETQTGRRTKKRKSTNVDVVTPKIKKVKTNKVKTPKVKTPKLGKKPKTGKKAKALQSVPTPPRTRNAAFTKKAVLSASSSPE